MFTGKRFFTILMFAYYFKKKNLFKFCREKLELVVEVCFIQRNRFANNEIHDVYIPFKLKKNIDYTECVRVFVTLANTCTFIVHELFYNHSFDIENHTIGAKGCATEF